MVGATRGDAAGNVGPVVASEPTTEELVRKVIAEAESPQNDGRILTIERLGTVVVL